MKRIIKNAKDKKAIVLEKVDVCVNDELIKALLKEISFVLFFVLPNSLLDEGRIEIARKRSGPIILDKDFERFEMKRTYNPDFVLFSRTSTKKYFKDLWKKYFKRMRIKVKKADVDDIEDFDNVSEFVKDVFKK